MEPSAALRWSRLAFDVCSVLGWGAAALLALDPPTTPERAHHAFLIVAGFSGLFILALVARMVAEVKDAKSQKALGDARHGETVEHHQQAATDMATVQGKLDSLRGPSPLARSELKVRANNIAGAIRGKTVLVRVIEAMKDPPDIFEWNKNRANATKAMLFEFNNNRHEIGRILTDFEACGLSVPPEISKLMEGYEQSVDGIEALERYVRETAKDL